LKKDDRSLCQDCRGIALLTTKDNNNMWIIRINRALDKETDYVMKIYSTYYLDKKLTQDETIQIASIVDDIRLLLKIFFCMLITFR